MSGQKLDETLLPIHRGDEVVESVMLKRLASTTPFELHGAVRLTILGFDAK